MSLITLSLYFQYGGTALHNATYMNNVDIINMILDHAVQIDFKDKVSIIKATTMLTTIPCRDSISATDNISQGPNIVLDMYACSTLMFCYNVVCYYGRQ